MAFQQGGGGMGGPGGPGGQVGGPPGLEHNVQATEYTLQGVMRFLQLEWHNHERARNSWDIERAEMKARIAKQEGEIRHSKKLNDLLERQTKMLEMALRSERNKARKQEPDNNASSTSQADASPAKTDHKAQKRHSENLVDGLVEPESSNEGRDQHRDKSRKYLERTMQEIQYLLSPPPHPPPPQHSLQNGHLPGLPEPPPLQQDEALLRRRSRPQQHQENGQYRADAPTSHQPLPTARGSEHSVVSDLAYDNNESSYPQQLPRVAQGQPDSSNQQRHPQSLPESNGQGLAPYVYEITDRTRQSESTSDQRGEPESDGWNFDEQQVLPDLPNHSRRPDTDAFPSAEALSTKLPPRAGFGSHRRRSSGAGSGRRRSSGSQETHDSGVDGLPKQDPTSFKVKFALRGHLDVVRTVIFTGGGSPSEPEICTAGDDGMIKRWIVPASYGNVQHSQTLNDLDIASYFTHRGHEGIITSLASCPSTSFSTGGRISGDGWIFSGGQDTTVRVWERGRVDPKATLDGHTDTVWTVCVLPGTCGGVFGPQSNQFGGSDRILLASGSADGVVKIWAVSAPPHYAAPQASNRRATGGGRRHSVTSGSNHPSSPQPNTATNTPFHYHLIHSITRSGDSSASPTCICPLSANGDNFVVSYSDSTVIVFDTRSGEELIGMASNETYNGTAATSINTVVATSSATLGSEPGSSWAEEQEEVVGAGPTGSAQGLEGVIISGHEDRYIRFYDANSGQCTYTMLAHPSAISSLSLSPDGHEAVSAGHDASIRFWSLDKRICTQDITSHRPMRGEGVCSVVWSQDGRYVVSAGGDGVVKVFTR